MAAMIAIVGTTQGMESAGLPWGGAGRLDGIGAGAGSGGGVTSVRLRGVVSCCCAASPDPTRLSVIAWFTASANAEYCGAVLALRWANTNAPRRSSIEYTLSIAPSLE